MSKSQNEIELALLKHLISDYKNIESAIQKGISEKHFIVSKNEKYSLNGKLFSLIKQYYEECGCALTLNALEYNLSEKKTVSQKTKAVFINLYDKIIDEEYNESDFHYIIKQIKQNLCWLLVGDMLDESQKALAEKDLESAVNVFQEYIQVIQTESDEYPHDQVTFDMAEAHDYFFEEYNKRIDNPSLYQGVEIGLPQIDEQTFGCVPPQLNAFIAPSSGGKSVQLLNCALYAHEKNQKNVLYLSFEMGGWICLLRHLSKVCRIPFSSIKGLKLTEEQLIIIKEALMKSQNSDNYFIYDVNIEDATPEYVDLKIKELIKTKKKPELVICDYIGNMTLRNANYAAKDHEKQAEIIAALFKIAGKHNIIIWTAQQTNRETVRETRKAKEAGKSITYSLDSVAGSQKLLYYGYYVIGMEPDKSNGLCWYHPVKMRDSPFEVFAAKFEPEYNSIYPISNEEQEPLKNLRTVSLGEQKERPRTNFKLDELENLDVPEENLEIDLSEWDTS